MWAGASVNFEYLVYGVVLMTFGFTFGQAVFLILVGNLSYLLLGVCSLQGPDAGTTAFTINRAAFGPNGSRLTALFNWATQVGFETEGLILVVFGGIALAAKAGFHPGTPLKVVLIIGGRRHPDGAARSSATPPSSRSCGSLVIPFVVLYVILAILTIGKADPGSIHHGANWQTMMGGLAFTITLSGLGWVESGNDFSRYLPRTASRRGIVGWVFVATAIPQAALMLLGAAVATYVQIDSKDPFNSFPHAFSSWFLVPFLVVAIVQLFAINSMDLYSSGVTLQALGVPVKRWNAVLIDTVIGCAITAYAVFSAGFSQSAQRLRRRRHRLDRPRGWRSSWSTGCCAASATCRASCSAPTPGACTGVAAGCTGRRWWLRRSARWRRCWRSIRRSTRARSPGPSAGAAPTSACSRASSWAAWRICILARAGRSPRGRRPGRSCWPRSVTAADRSPVG